MKFLDVEYLLVNGVVYLTHVEDEDRLQELISFGLLDNIGTAYKIVYGEEGEYYYYVEQPDLLPEKTIIEKFSLED